MAARSPRPPRELIAQHLEPDVVEVYGNGALALAQADEHAALRALAARVEVSGETVFFYTHRPCRCWPR